MQNAVEPKFRLVPSPAEAKPVLYETAFRNHSEMLLPVHIPNPSLPPKQRTAAKEELRKMIVEVIRLALSVWEEKKGKNKFDLADESGLWTVTTDKETGISRTQTLDRYLKMSSLPKKPRTENVLKTARFVLAQSPASETSAELKEKTKQLEALLRESD